MQVIFFNKLRDWSSCVAHDSTVMCGAKLDILFNLPVKFQNYLPG